MNKTISQIQQGLTKRDFSSVEITQDYLAAIKQHNPAINCYISITEDLALQQAKAADQRIASGEAQLLTGVPIAHKDVFCT
ncbi:MAG: amidase family protein, partial [Gammaproteobacteria bacterium]|nr:amidase family protein [Gammaproteobacteria bacterium]